MIIFLPEKIYEEFKDDETLKNLFQKVSETYYNRENNYDLKKFLQLDEKDFKEVNEYLLKNVSKKYKQELEICLNAYGNNANKYLETLEKYDVETQIYLYYVYNDGDMAPTEELFKHYNEIVRLYESNDTSKFSPFIHTIYYFVKLYLHWINEDILKYVNKNGFFEFEKIKELLTFEENLFNQILTKCDTEQFFHILYHKRIQMMYMFMLFIGRYCDNFDKVVEAIIRIAYNNRFKYDNFNYLKLAINHIIFQTYFDKMNFAKAKQYLFRNISIINYGFEHKHEMVKALNHFNKVFTKEFCNFLYYLYTMVRIYLPNAVKEFKILEAPLATEFEKRLLFGKLNKDEKTLGIELNPNDWLSFKWCQQNKTAFDFFNKSLDKLK